jgi:hypothetical protein
MRPDFLLEVEAIARPGLESHKRKAPRLEPGRDAIENVAAYSR